MATSVRSGTEPRMQLSRQRVLLAAVKVADESGTGALTMRRIAEELGAEAMSLYYHVANKQDLLAGVVDVVVDEINLAVGSVTEDPGGWKAVARKRILLSREVLLRHPWAPRLLEAYSDRSPAVIIYHDRLVGILREGGFSYDLIHHALHALGSRALGFTQELMDPAPDGGNGPGETLEGLADKVPYLAAMLNEVVHDDPASTIGWCDDQTEFEFGLDLILDGLERLRDHG